MTAKSHGLDLFYYLAYVFKHLPGAKTVKDVESLLPWNVDGEQMKQTFGVVKTGCLAERLRIIETAKANGVNTDAYLKMLLEELPERPQSLAIDDLAARAFTG